MVVTFILMLTLGSKVPELVFLFYVLICGTLLYGLIGSFAHNKAIAKFALLNNLPEGQALLPPYLDGVGEDQKLSNSYGFMVDGKPCTIAEYHYETGEGKSRQGHTYTVAYFIQGKAYPHLFLDGQQNGRWEAYSGSQRLSLEGDFNDFFNLYVPDGESVDALSILTPDVMQTLVTGGRPYDIETQENYVFVVGKGSHYSYEKLPQLLKFMTSLSQEFDQKDVTWNDTQLVAGAGQDLKRSAFGLTGTSGNKWSLAILLLVILYWIVTLTHIFK